MNGYEIVTTKYGAPAMLDHGTGEVMHPVVGPLIESENLYIAPSQLELRLRTHSLVIYDVGLGAGSNAALAWQLSEARPASENHLQIVSFDRTTQALEAALQSPVAGQFALGPNVHRYAETAVRSHFVEGKQTSWRIILGELPATLTQAPPADIVFWDPFSPKANPDLWSMRALQSLAARCKSGTTVHTYSAATATRSAFLLAGFYVGVGLSSGDKAQTTLAATSLDTLAQPLDLRWLKRLTRSSAPFPHDAPSDAMQRILAHPQFAAHAADIA